MNARSLVIRDGREVYVLREFLTNEELADLAERERSPFARRRFGLLLRRVRKIADAPVKAALKAGRQRLRELDESAQSGSGQ